MRSLSPPQRTPDRRKPAKVDIPEGSQSAPGALMGIRPGLCRILDMTFRERRKSEVRRIRLLETVWKIGIDSIPHSHESENGARSALFSPLGAIKTSQSRPLQLLSKQFLRLKRRRDSQASLHLGVRGEAAASRRLYMSSSASATGAKQPTSSAADERFPRTAASEAAKRRCSPHMGV